MQVDDCYQLGYVIKPHGLNGELQFLLDVDSPQEYSALESVFVLQGQQLVPFFIESIAVRGNKAIVALEEVESVDEAWALKGAELYLPLAVLPELPDDQYYYHDLVGFALEKESGELIGEIQSVLDAGAQDLLQVKHTSGKEVLVPLTDELIVKVDKTGRKLIMNLPEGLIEVYLNEES